MGTVRTRRGFLQRHPGTRTQTPSSSPVPFSCYNMQPGRTEMLQGVPKFLSHSRGSCQILGNNSGNKLGTEHPGRGSNSVQHGARKSLRGKDGLVDFTAHNPEVAGSNPAPATKISFLSAASANPATIRICSFPRWRFERSALLPEFGAQHTPSNQMLGNFRVARDSRTMR